MTQLFKFICLLLLLTSMPLLGGCGSSPEVLVVSPTSQTVEATVASVTSGTVRAEKVAELAFGAVGRVRKLNIELGDRVQRGQILAELENQDLSTRLKTEEAELQRRVTLQARGLLSNSEVDLARSSYDMAKIALDKTLIIAPFDGLVAELNLEEGQLSQITAVIPKALIRLVDDQNRYAHAEVDEVDLPRIKTGLPVRVRILAVRKEPFQGVVRKVVPYVSSLREEDRTTEIEVNLESEGILLPVGASADVDIIVESRSDVMALPSRVVLGRTGERYVYAVIDNKVRKTPVQVGVFNYDWTEIQSGVDQSALVVQPSEGLSLADGQSVKVRRAE